ncbi:MAG: hypothetical protein ACU85V_09875 [Gammaproteobacteria bacterium]
MPSFREILTASDAELVQIFYRVKAGGEDDFIRKINHAAAQLGLNHAQLVCALGFNHNIRELTDILSVIGFSSYKLLRYRRNELFTTDTYQELDIDNVLDIYVERIDNDDMRAALQELVAPRLANIEQRLNAGEDPAMAISYKMEVHSIYTGGLATPEFVSQRVEQPNGDLRMMIDEIQMILEQDIVPPAQLFFSDYLLPAEKQALLDSGQIERAMVEQRLADSDVSEDERQVLEDYLER